MRGDCGFITISSWTPDRGVGADCVRPTAPPPRSITQVFGEQQVRSHRRCQSLPPKFGVKLFSPFHGCLERIFANAAVSGDSHPFVASSCHLKKRMHLWTHFPLVHFSRDTRTVCSPVWGQIFAWMRWCWNLSSVSSYHNNYCKFSGGHCIELALNMDCCDVMVS